ncbi:hypothetical protein D7319_24755 [Streptomyces radicis]|uniref:Uncharacterized protein n=1 Tax=Streptomyces radicis TaxID=1750517 RepID=A0A3A9VY91_9ACTN|nr:hypothetical protein D7319_24755 [Streptomyces radicis]RKN17361.1 hypothetical protein D7318_24120 [Streptomyces radicis]
MIPLSTNDDTITFVGSSASAAPREGPEEADQRTLAAARWLMPSLPSALVAEVLGLSHGDG